jgi:membrane protease YdiL (CAAX protease family)
MLIDSSSKETKDLNLVLRVFKALFLVLATIIIFFVSQIIGVFIVYGFLLLLGFSSEEIEVLVTENSGWQFFAILIISLVTLGVLWTAHKLNKLNFLKIVSLDRRPKLKDFGISLLTYVFYFITLIIVVGVVSWLIPAIDVDQAQQIGFESASGYELIFVFLTLVIIPPLLEEILFRGFLFKRLNGLIKFWPSAVITSIIFALAHTEFLGDNPLNWIAAIDTFILSFFLIFLLHKTGSLWPSIFLHGIKNSIAFVVLFII